MTWSARFITIPPLLAALGGCRAADPVYFTDSVDFSFDFVQQLLPMFSGADILHGPYVVGSSFTVFVNTQRSTQSMATWGCESSDDSVFTVDVVAYNRGEAEASDWLAVTVTITGEGMADFVVLDGDREIDVATIDARVPDAAELHAAAPLFVDTGDLVPTLSTSPRILTGGEATYQVRWFQGGEPLNGHGALTVESADDVLVTTETTWFFEDRDWVHVFPRADGPATFTLQAFGFDVQDVTIEAVPDTALSRIEVFGGDEGGAEDGAWLALMAQAVDADEQPIHGVEYEWDRDGVAELGIGDLYRYEFDPFAEVTMQASYGELSSSRTIHAAGGYVDSSNQVGCDVTSRPSLVLGALALLLLRRRSR